VSERADIVSKVAEQIRVLIVGGDLSGGVRLNETHLAKHLGVSRTPIREALRRLVGEGAVIAIPNLGFFVAELSAHELDEIYMLRPVLDMLALRLGGLPRAETLAEMRDVNRLLAETKSSGDAVDLDDRWHRLLISECRNSVLITFIDQLIARTRRYELTLFADLNQRLDAARQHDAVIDALAGQDLDSACAALTANLTRGDEPLRALLNVARKELVP
jgi:DNA-binding GntR family transcriptional regulator